MGQASVLNESEIRRVFRIIETTRHAERNRLCFVLSLYSGLRVGEIAALTIGDVATQNGDVRREIKLGVHQTKGSKGCTVILSERVRKELGSFLKNMTNRDQGEPLVASQRNGLAFTNVSLSMCCSRKFTNWRGFVHLPTREDVHLRRDSMKKGLG